MIITLPWLKEHLKTNANESEIIDKLTNIGLEVEGLKENSSELSKFKIAKIIKAEKHPNADKLKVCDVSIGGKEIVKVVCGAPNARDGLVTLYAPPGTVIPKTKFIELGPHPDPVAAEAATVFDDVTYGYVP